MCRTHRSDSSAAWLASESLAVAVARRSSDLSRSSSSSWMRRLRAATSDSACVTKKNSINICFKYFSGLLTKHKIHIILAALLESKGVKKTVNT